MIDDYYCCLVLFSLKWFHLFCPTSVTCYLSNLLLIISVFFCVFCKRAIPGSAQGLLLTVLSEPCSPGIIGSGPHACKAMLLPFHYDYKNHCWAAEIIQHAWNLHCKQQTCVQSPAVIGFPEPHQKRSLSTESIKLSPEHCQVWSQTRQQNKNHCQELYISRILLPNFCGRWFMISSL